MVNVETIRQRGASRLRAGSNASQASSVADQLGIRDPRERLSSLASDVNNGYGSGNDEKDNHRHPKLRNRRSSKGKLAVKLKRNLRSLMFQNPRIYIDYYQKSQGFQAEYVTYEENGAISKQATDTYTENYSLAVGRFNSAQSNGYSTGPDDEYYSHDDEDPFPTTKKKKKKKKGNSSPIDIQMGSNNFKKSKKKSNKKKHPIVECEGIQYLQYHFLRSLCIVNT